MERVFLDHLLSYQDKMVILQLPLIKNVFLTEKNIKTLVRIKIAMCKYTYI